MSYRISHILTAVAAAAIMASSCIEETHSLAVATEDQVTLQTLIKGIPSAMMEPGSAGYASSGQAWDFGIPAIHLATESMTGDLIVTGNIGYDWFQQWGTNDALGQEYAVCVLTWNTYYRWIAMCNDIIRKISTIDASEVTQTDRHYLGTAYTYRAYCYLDLVRLYEYKENKYTDGDGIVGLSVPLVTEESTEEQAKNNPRATADEIFEKVIFPDLEKAEELLSDYSPANRYAVSLALVYGLKARSYIDRATAHEDADLYANAAEYARKAITSSSCTPLTQTEWEDPTNGFNNASSNNSWIWGLPLASENVASLFCFTAHMSNEQSWAAYGFAVGRGINKNLYNSIDRNDFRKHSWLDPDRSSYEYKSCRQDSKTYFAESLADYVNIKFRPAGGECKISATGGAADHPMMRVEEMYFIEAEAKAHESLNEGISLLNAFMNNYRIVGGGYDCAKKATSLKAFINELLLQKRIEFWGEGIVMFDLKRLDVSTKRGYVGTNSPTSYRLNTDGRAPYWNFVISRGEVQNNKAIIGKNNPDPSGIIKPWTE
ncbi:MAG: RagB/SusD family nutrient uptake outer membrane protein [Candidatus Cryptobacteroides sp.]|nr:RagB/SusD family nutrient uptake outer membrane protein [Bacteroidales bacterium]MDD7153833.1 RagB/SusD family nutrient uptake outer membrane protein [Bacteroidales bacterium]MDY4572428.1 RagB/SusD family nutrient uptake outer membrane protein [Candidatus Cryptobacteroides sp.]MDY5495410.1 RagB/SusD family nutrient uptake outer membrane protein [Candidatus Cryptobacteroides sp.]MDY6183753.1 RagB/SusD family nutrient uptake outer membrane protein [Candidatus Cryptobacteroides sp.]